ncbi:MAG TPA: tRNA uridine-5-carboxymethylaminomethyl(34) synthesis GTPase MnmE [Gemmatimonadaceae bacterium]|nr:tRNA uridine-5-carboxymethylaminomethyl(34) synthesis GTPase MnmE [Gemmatimonadaceae bacterium]
MNDAAGSPLHPTGTIVAQATAAGRGALAIVRLSGPDAHRIARAAAEPFPAAPRTAVVCRIRDASGAALDEAVVVRYDAPASFTGEDAVEITTHGGLVVPTTVVAALIARGARLAEPGEFTRRAVLNGKLDILQAEATGDLIESSSRAAQRTALRQLDGGLSRRVLALRDAAIRLEALIAYDIDFPEEDDGPVPAARILGAADELIRDLEMLEGTARAGELVRDGALVVLAGAPNVGKSSLFNALVGQNRAIVTDIPGTTRDAIEAVIDTPTLPIRLVDTAGLRETQDPVERLGVEVSTSYLNRASVVLVCGDDAASLGQGMAATEGRTMAPRIEVRTKADLAVGGQAKNSAWGGDHAAIRVSAETGEGLDELVSAIVSAASGGLNAFEADAPLLTRERHRYAVGRALAEVRAFRERWGAGDLPAPVAGVHLREATAALEDLIGAIDVEDVLDELFRRFCVGK